MSTGQIVALALAALAVFWMLGGYNRLVALRNGIGVAWAALDEVLQRRGAAVEPLVSALRTPLAAEQGALDALLAAQMRLVAAAALCRARPVRADAMAELAAAEAAFAPPASRVLALLEQQAGLSGQDGVAVPLAVLQEAPPRLDFARQRFNEVVAQHNEALQQFPTSLLARLYGFQAAGRL